MPELPEVETIKRTLERFIVNKTIEDVAVFWGKIIQRPDDVEHFRQILIGETFQKVERKGKFLLFYLTNHVLVSHLRMEGKYQVVPGEQEKNKHTHVVFRLTSCEELRYEDVRKFGTMHVFPIGQEQNETPLRQLGPDPFEAAYRFEYVQERLQKTTRWVKAALLDQTIIAGLGNIYLDEVLFLSKVHPARRAHTLTDEEIKRIVFYTKEVLQRAVEQGGTTIRSYVNGAGEMGMFQQDLYAYGQENTPCKLCGTEIIKLKVAGRGTHICPQCQVLEGEKV